MYRNQCDGCCSKMPTRVTALGSEMHVDRNGNAVMVCQAYRYSLDFDLVMYPELSIPEDFIDQGKFFEGTKKLIDKPATDILNYRYSI